MKLVWADIRNPVHKHQQFKMLAQRLSLSEGRGLAAQTQPPPRPLRLPELSPGGGAAAPVAAGRCCSRASQNLELNHRRQNITGCRRLRDSGVDQAPALPPTATECARWTPKPSFQLFVSKSAGGPNDTQTWTVRLPERVLPRGTHCGALRPAWPDELGASSGQDHEAGVPPRL